MRKYAAVLALGALLPAAHAATLLGTTTYGGHTYSLYQSTSPVFGWTDADAYASSMSNSYLATSTSAGENAAIAGLVAQHVDKAFLGGVQVNQASTGGANDDWSWSNGETWGYTNWAGHEPNDFFGPQSEQYLEMYSSGEWNDILNNYDGWNRGAFVVETVPEPASLAALGLGLAAFARRRRKNG